MDERTRLLAMACRRALIMIVKALDVFLGIEHKDG
jgi:hypothetical protein